MDHHHHDEKYIAFPPDMNAKQLCFYLCRSKCPAICLPPIPPILLFSPPPPPPPPPPHPHPPPHLLIHSKQDISAVVIIIIGVILASAFLLLIYYYSIIVKYFDNRSTSRRSETPPTNTHEENYQTQNPMDFIWHIRTVGLEESVINSITVCKYKREEGLIEETVCSVCMNEFQEDEDLRLLPKCSHAFHLPCIDTWLKSHVNCPLCRAIIFSNLVGSPSTDPTATSYDLVDESRVGNLQSHIELGSSQRNEIFGSQIFAHENVSELEDFSFPRASSGFRALSDLIHRGFAIEMMDDETRRVRRSVSMDSLSSAISCISLPNLPSIDTEGSSTASRVLSKGSKKFNLGESSALNRIFPKHGWNQDISKMLSNDSRSVYPQKGSVSMERSFSGSWRFLLPRYGRSKNSIIPL